MRKNVLSGAKKVVRMLCNKGTQRFSFALKKTNIFFKDMETDNLIATVEKWIKKIPFQMSEWEKDELRSTLFLHLKKVPIKEYGLLEAEVYTINYDISYIWEEDDKSYDVYFQSFLSDDFHDKGRSWYTLCYWETTNHPCKEVEICSEEMNYPWKEVEIPSEEVIKMKCSINSWDDLQKLDKMFLPLALMEFL